MAKVDDSELEMVGQPNVVIWDSRWKEEERAVKRDEAIDCYLAEPSPPGLYGVNPIPEMQGPRLSGARAVPSEKKNE